MSTPSQKTADQWNRRLVYFRFYFAHGGHANDMDDLSASIRFEQGEAGLRDVFSRLGVELQRIPPTMPRRELGRSYNSADWDKFADGIPAYPQFRCPGFTRIEGKPVHLAVFADYIRVGVSGARGNHWVIDDADFQNALSLETLLPELGIHFVPIASREQIEALFHVLRSHSLSDWVTYARSREVLISKKKLSTEDDDVALETYKHIRSKLAPEFRDDHIWIDAHEQIHGLVSSALNYEANPGYVAHRCPGFSPDVIERVCAEAKRSLR